jgi:circadian clock protein KaiC
MLGGKGFYKGGSILVSGTAGTGKTSIAASFVNAACNSNNKCLFLAFEESPQQIVRNMHSIGMNLEKHIDKGLLHFYASRPTMYGLEMHLVTIHKLIRQIKPDVVVLDPITNLISIGSVSEVKAMLVRLIDFLQQEQITVMFTALTLNNIINEQTDEGVSSLVDAWIQVKDIEINGERNRSMYIMKSRGMQHSNQVREFVITGEGLDLRDVYLGPEGVLTGSAREAQILLEETGQVLHNNAVDRKDRELLRKRKMLEAQIESLKTEFESTEEELNKAFIEERIKKEVMELARQKMTDIRRGTTGSNNNQNTEQTDNG